jgi:hypothetical protein
MKRGHCVAFDDINEVDSIFLQRRLVGSYKRSTNNPERVSTKSKLSTELKDTDRLLTESDTFDQVPTKDYSSKKVTANTMGSPGDTIRETATPRTKNQQIYTGPYNRTSKLAGQSIYKFHHRRPQAERKWWSISEETWEQYAEWAQRDLTHVGLIMETDFGGEVEKKCGRC